MFLSAVLATSCAIAGASERRAKRQDAQAIATRDQIYACNGGPPFPRGALNNPVGAESRNDPASRALQRWIDYFDGVEFPRRRWLELVRTPDLVLFGRVSRGRLTHDVLVERQGSAWRAGRGGGCTPTLSVPGFELPEFALRQRPAPRSRTVRLTVDTGSCDPARASADVRSRFDHVETRPGRLAIRLIVLIREPVLPPNAVCAGVGISYPVDVRLPFRVGRRPFLNAATAPSTRVQVRPRL
jgi:hypothetical protein